ncbi:MAG: DNA polymerase III subunit delta' [Deltaproteobacteria bacterium]|nr:MAG: DNA polymerase III subunit delta' [Deltaproteobacteria bacterium]
MSPKLFKEIIGQEKAIGFLRGVIASDKIAPAYLFTGIQGIGKRTTAMAFALLLNCANPVDGDGCKRCSSCKKISDGNHPDLIFIGPDQEKKAIGIDQIREINRHLAFSPVLGQRRIIVIDPAEKMSDEAANAFLKALEEPPPGNILILNVRDPDQLPSTIVSRCQRVPFKPLPTQDIEDWLLREGNVDKESAKILARLSEGSLGEAIKLAHDDLFTERVNLVTTLHSVMNGSPDMLLDLAQKFSDLGKRAATNRELKDDRIALMLGIWKSLFRDMLVIKLGGAVDLILNSDLTDHLKKASTVYSFDGLMRSLAVIARAEHDLMENRNILFLLERSLIGLKGAARF